mmetsp:Transcript_89457/g.239792  ORF Transcript_89457/g.239792 Transcript_89457/m.239792 type:complete len:207 (+) Transcript_89457:1579-2199(+)
MALQPVPLLPVLLLRLSLECRQRRQQIRLRLPCHRQLPTQIHLLLVRLLRFLDHLIFSHLGLLHGLAEEVALLHCYVQLKLQVLALSAQDSQRLLYTVELGGLLLLTCSQLRLASLHDVLSRGPLLALLVQLVLQLLCLLLNLGEVPLLLFELRFQPSGLVGQLLCSGLMLLDLSPHAVGEGPVLLLQGGHLLLRRRTQGRLLLRS